VRGVAKRDRPCRDLAVLQLDGLVDQHQDPRADPAEDPQSALVLVPERPVARLVEIRVRKDLADPGEVEPVLAHVPRLLARVRDDAHARLVRI
jgi:hypothetical protein